MANLGEIDKKFNSLAMHASETYIYNTQHKHKQQKKKHTNTPKHSSHAKQMYCCKLGKLYNHKKQMGKEKKKKLLDHLNTAQFYLLNVSDKIVNQFLQKVDKNCIEPKLETNCEILDDIWS